MALFSFDLERTLTALPTPPRTSKKKSREASTADFASAPAAFASDNGERLSSDEMQDQFVVFQLNDTLDGPAILNAEAVTPKLAGDEEAPDVLAKLNLLAFHVSADEKIDRDTRATMRINFGKDPSSTDRNFDTAFWAIAAGLKLYNEATGKAAQTKELSADIDGALGRRPIEIPGGLGSLSFEVVKHREPAWWQKVFSFLESGTGRGLTAVLGFPAVAQGAIGIIDELVGRLADDEPEVLFKSRPMRLALTARAHDEFPGGSPRIRLGALNSGYCVLARYRDFAAIAASDAVFYPSQGLLAPAKADPGNVASLTTKNPLHAMTYAVFRVRMKSAAIDPSFGFR